MLSPVSIVSAYDKVQADFMKRLAKLSLPIVAAVILMQAVPQMAWAQSNSESPERVLFDSANRERAAQGLPALRWDDELAKAAHQHAVEMVEHNSLSHQFPGELDLAVRVRQTAARFWAPAENVANGPSAASIHKQWMASPPHRANLLNPKLNALGVAVEDRNGQLFAVEDFSQALAKLSLVDQETALSGLLRNRGLSLLGDTGDATQVCEREGAYNFDRRPAFLLRFTTMDLAHLPDVLLRELQNDPYHTAAVAACAPSSPNGFAGYQFAVLLYQ